MSAEDSKTFFKNLKEMCKKIEQTVEETKKEFYAVPDDGDLAAKKVIEIQDKIKTMKVGAEEILHALKPRIAHINDFIQHFKELTTETEVLVSRQENHLRQYGYQPLELITESTPSASKSNDSSPVKMMTSPVKESQKRESISVTPNLLLDYGIVSRNTYSGLTSESKDRKSSFEDLQIPRKIELERSVISQTKNSDSTPTLELNFPLTAETDKETPPLPEYTSVGLSTPTLVLQ